MSYPSYHYNTQNFTSPSQSLMLYFTNGNYINTSLAPETYEVVTTYSHKLFGWKLLPNVLHTCNPHIGGYNGGVHIDLVTMAFKINNTLKNFPTEPLVFNKRLISLLKQYLPS